MKDLKKSKKFYNWTAKQKGKKRSKKPRFHNAPKDYCKPYWEQHKAREKKEITRFLKGVDEGFLNFPYHHKNSATWDYW